jgi:CheY-like chemotaxis protein
MKILVVDDDNTVVDFFTQAANAMGHSDIDTAGTGEEALGKVIRDTYDLITLDIRMPGASGLEILSPLRNMCPHAIIAVISGHIPDQPTLDLAGCADLVLGKPVDLEKFSKLLQGAELIYKTMEDIKELSEGTLETP